MGREVKNIPASIIAKLRNYAKDNMFTMNSVLQRFANERFLFRLSQSNKKGAFILKGGMMLIAQNVNLRRPTRDIDIRSIENIDLGDLKEVVKSICLIEYREDGLIFDPDSVQGDLMRVHQGAVIRFKGLLGETQIKMRLDISYDEVETIPDPVVRKMPTILNHTSPILLCYKFETSIAEKIETAVSRGDANIRFKDFFDVWLIISNEKVIRKDMAAALESVFSL